MKTLWILAAAATFAACHNRSSDETGAAPDKGDSTMTTIDTTKTAPNPSGYDTTAAPTAPSGQTYDTTSTSVPSPSVDTTMNNPSAPTSTDSTQK